MHLVGFIVRTNGKLSVFHFSQNIHLFSKIDFITVIKAKVYGFLS